MVIIELVKDPAKVFKNLTLEKMAKDKRKHVIFMTPEVFCKVFSPERLRLLMFVNKNRSASISDLARKLGRRFEAVHRDLMYLEGFSVVKLRRQEANRIPYVDDSIEVKMVSV